MIDFISLCDVKTSLHAITKTICLAIWNLYDLTDKFEENDLKTLSNEIL